MRTIITILLAALLLPVVAGCSNEAEVSPFLNETGPKIITQYTYVCFEDKDGEDLMSTLELCDTLVHKPYDIIKVQQETYSLKWSSVDKDYNRNNGFLWCSMINGQVYINLERTFIDDMMPSVAYFLQCESLFGDMEWHVMEIEYEESQRECYTKCVRFTLDGVEYEVDDDDRVVVKL